MKEAEVQVEDQEDPCPEPVRRHLLYYLTYNLRAGLCALHM